MSHPLEARNFIDRAIEAISPALAARRYAARASIEVARSVPSASYRGAVSTRSSAPWSTSTSYRGGRSSTRRDQGSMRDRANHAYQNNPIARSLLNTETDSVVSDGYILQMQTGDEAFNAEAEGRFYSWLDRADITGHFKGSGLFRATWREPRKAGDGGMVLIIRGGYPYLQYIPGDLIRNPYANFDYRTMRDGVECDPAGRPVRFWVRDVDEAGKDTVSPIAARDFVWWAHTDDDPLSVRGTTVYSTIFGLLDQFDAYVDAVTKAAIMGAIFGLIEKRRNPAAATAGLGTLTNSQGDQQKAVTYENGMLKVIGTDESVFQVQASQPLQQTPEFIRTLTRLICRAFDMPIEVGMNDFSQVNFSGGQLGMKSYEQSCRVKQDWHIVGRWDRIVFWWLSKERERQRLGYPDAFKTPFPEDYGRFALHAREWQLRDRYGEAKADLLEMSIGVSSPQRACARRSVDYKQNQAERVAAWKENDTLGLPNLLATDTRDATTNGGDPSAPDPALEKTKAEIEAYGVSVRAGVVTPQPDDENAFRARLALPPMSDAAKAAWEIDKGVRRPITITPAGGAKAASPFAPQPATPDDDTTGETDGEEAEE